MRTIFLLSPAHCGGRRARILMNPKATFPLAVRLREAQGLSLGDAFAFMSGLYFRGKLAYARAFTEDTASAALVIAPGRGLLSVDHPLDAAQLLAMAEIPVSLAEPRYRLPLQRDARALADQLGLDDRVVLLGSIATDKYVSVLQECLDDRVLFPREFVGRGDMSRGGLMLRCADERRELTYVPIAGATRHGPRPEKLVPRARRAAALGGPSTET